MCGILGVYDSEKCDIKKFNKSLKFLYNRGPDNQSTKELNKKLFFGHTRLSIIDLDENSNQPFNVDNNYYITYNGELYNYKEIRDELIKQGFKFKTSSDTEVVLKSYIRWGKDSVKKFNGMWAFAIFDRIENNLFCSRDRYGIKPFYYFFNEEKFVFSSMIKPIVNYHSKIVKPNIKSINEFLYRGNLSQFEDTWFEEVKKLLPGHNLSFDFKKIKIEKYYKLNFIKNNFSFNKTKSLIQNLLKDSVKLRLRSDVRVSSTLTSGIDSSSILSMVNEIEKTKIETYTAYSKDASFSYNDTKDFLEDINLNESDAIKYFKDFNINSNLVATNDSNYLLDLIECIYNIESGHASPAIVPIKKLYKKVNEDDCKVLLEGQGGDELFGGYITELIMPVILNNILRPKYILRFLKKIGKTYKFKELFKRFLNSFKNNYLFIRIKIFVLKLEVSDQLKFHKPKKIKNIFRYQQEEVLASLLKYGDSLSMAHSVENRFPFLDYRIVDFANSIPLKYKVFNDKGKYILRESMKDFLPKEIYESNIKNGFAVPIDSLMKKNKEIKRILYENSKYNFFNEKKLKIMLDNYFEEKFEHPNFIFKILTIKIWLEIFFKK